jgi:hypothetical protein
MKGGYGMGSSRWEPKHPTTQYLRQFGLYLNRIKPIEKYFDMGMDPKHVGGLLIFLGHLILDHHGHHDEIAKCAALLAGKSEPGG